MKLTKKEYEKYLNEDGAPMDNFWMAGKFREIYYNRGEFGTALRKYDPIAFEVGFGEWVSDVARDMERMGVIK